MDAVRELDGLVTRMEALVVRMEEALAKVGAPTDYLRPRPMGSLATAFWQRPNLSPDAPASNLSPADDDHA